MGILVCQKTIRMGGREGWGGRCKKMPRADSIWSNMEKHFCHLICLSHSICELFVSFAMQTITPFDHNLTWKAKEDVIRYVEDWGKKNFVMLAKRTSSGIQLIWVCIHGEFANRSKGGERERLITHTYHSGCPFRISTGFSKKNNMWHVSKVNPVHIGHDVDEETYKMYSRNNRLDEEEIEKLESLTNAAYVRPSVLATIASNRSGKSISNRYIQNLHLNKDGEDDSKLKDYLGKLQGIHLLIAYSYKNIFIHFQ